MILAELEVFHSRPIAPTRRVALGHSDLPVMPAPGFGGLLLGGLVASSISAIDTELHNDLLRLTYQLEDGRRISQPRLRHRLQTDHIGLSRYRHRLRGDGEELRLDLDDNRSAAPSVLAAIYAAGALIGTARSPVMEVIRKGLAWRGAVDDGLFEHLAGVGGRGRFSVSIGADPVGWAIGVLGLEAIAPKVVVRADHPDRAPSLPRPARAEVQRRFRDLLRQAHPDHGGADEAAADRIAELAEARRILLAG